MLVPRSRRVGAVPKLGLVLGGGGVAGVAHIPVLQALDEAGARPTVIAGTSIGALIGVMYAAGMTGDAIRAHIEHLGRRPLRALAHIARRGGVTFNKGLPALHAPRFVRAVLPRDVPERFEDLPTPLRIIATDFRNRRPVALDTGDLFSAVAASIAIPGVFRAVDRSGTLLIDGGIAENLPLARVPDADLVLAVNVFLDRPLPNANVPGNIRSVGSTVRLMLCRQVAEGLRAHPPDILIEPPFQPGGPRALFRVEKMLADADALRADTLRRLAEHA